MDSEHISHDSSRLFHEMALLRYHLQLREGLLRKREWSLSQ